MMISENTLKKFSDDIANFKNSKYNYSYNFNTSQSLFFSKNSSEFNQTLLKFSVSDFNYNTASYSQHENLNFVDFATPISTESTSSIQSDPTQIISDLNNTVSTLTAQLSSSMVDSTELSSAQADISASKDIIISLRIQAGQGKVATDFSQYFPYLPINVNPG